jgi:hypothetical protein
MTNYKRAKIELKRIAVLAKDSHLSDRPMIRAIINDHADYLCKTGELTEYEQNLLHNYACTLHPKD